MRKPSLNTALLSTLFVAALAVVACNKSQPAAPVAAASANATSIVFVNSDSVLNGYEYFKEVRASFEEKSKKAQADLSAKGQAFQREAAEYQKNAAAMSASDRAATEERLGRKQQELGTNSQNVQMELARTEAAENEKLYNKVSEYLKGYAKEKGYKFVLTYSKSDPTVLYGDPTLDVTKDVITGLNDTYKKEKK